MQHRSYVQIFKNSALNIWRRKIDKVSGSVEFPDDGDAGQVPGEWWKCGKALSVDFAVSIAVAFLVAIFRE